MSLNLLDITSNDIIKYITQTGNRNVKVWTAFHREEWIEGLQIMIVLFLPNHYQLNVLKTYKFYLTGNENLKKTFWKPNVVESHTVEKQCAVVEVRDSKIWWLPENCEEQHEFICSQGQRHNQHNYLCY